MVNLTSAPRGAGRLETGAARGRTDGTTPLSPVIDRLGRALRPDPGDAHGAYGRLAAEHFHELEVELHPAEGSCWYYMKPAGRPSFTPGLLGDIRRFQTSVDRLFEAAPDAPLRHLVLASRMPGIFNLGGDLGLFAEKIRSGDRAVLSAYARACIDVLYPNAVSLERRLVTIALVQGDALGGGFEAALSCNVIVAERDAKFGLPEVLFNLFPGMGAYSFLSRRIGSIRAEELILSGKVYGAEELHALGVVDVLAEPGKGEEAVRAYIRKTDRRHNAREAVYRARRRVNPITYEELCDVTDIWVDAALRLGEPDLKKMLRLAAAQDRRRAASRKEEGDTAGVAAE